MKNSEFTSKNIKYLLFALYSITEKWQQPSSNWLPVSLDDGIHAATKFDFDTKQNSWVQKNGYKIAII